MRKLLIVCSMALLLPGCASLQNLFGGLASATPGQLVMDVQNAAVATCRFLPTAETVANIIALNNPILATATSIANAICAAVVPSTPVVQAVRRTINRNAAVPTVSGVPIYGQLIR